MKLLLPPPPGTLGGPVMNYLARIVQALQQAMVPIVTDFQATRRIILLSPNGTSYDVTVDDAGVLHTTLNPGRATGGAPLASTKGY